MERWNLTTVRKKAPQGPARLAPQTLSPEQMARSEAVESAGQMSLPVLVIPPAQAWAGPRAVRPQQRMQRPATPLPEALRLMGTASRVPSC